MISRLSLKSKLFALLLSALCTAFIPIQPEDTMRRDVMVVFLELSSPFCSTEEKCTPDFSQELVDTIHPPRHHFASSYENLLKITMADYIREATFSQSILSFTAVLNPDRSDGWFEAPHRLEDYNDPPGAAEPVAIIARDALNLAGSVIGATVNDFDILLVVVNIQSLYGFTTGIDQYPLVVVGENSDDDGFLEVVAHELGHVHGLQHVKMGPYDIVGNSDVLTHYGGFSKVFAGWVPEITDMPCMNGPCEITTVLDPLERPGNNVLRIPFTSFNQYLFMGYFVECRAKIGFDQKIPEEGVIISNVNSVFPPVKGEFANIVFPLGDNEYSNAALSPGETFVDEARKITITYLSKSNLNECTVKAERGEITAPDLVIEGYDTAIENSAGLGHNSIDIWIDSEKNGWGIYGSGDATPTSYGDPFWVDHENRIKFKVRNNGYGPAENVKVSVYVRQPLLIEIPGMNCQGPKNMTEELVGSVVIDLVEANTAYFGEVPWTPKTNNAALVTVIIDDYIGEISHANNMAKESYTSQFQSIENTVSGTEIGHAISGFNREIISVETVKNCLTGIPFKFQPLEQGAISKRDWVMEISQAQGIAEIEETTEIELMSIQPENAQPGDCGDTGVVISAMIDDYYIPIETLTFRSCKVDISKITCAVDPEEVKEGSDLSISGELTPVVPEGLVALEFTGPGGEITIENTSVGINGKYSYSFVPVESGDWNVKVYWQGDEKTSPSESEICNFRVESDKPQFTLNHNINCRSGPGTEYPVITSGLIGDVIEVEARSSDVRWLYGMMNYKNCWVSLELGKLNVHPWSLPEKQSLPQPVQPADSNTDCSIYTSEIGCNSQNAVCKWVVQSTIPGVCLPK